MSIKRDKMSLMSIKGDKMSLMSIKGDKMLTDQQSRCGK